MNIAEDILSTMGGVFSTVGDISPTALNIPCSTQDIPHFRDIPNGTDTPHGAEHTLNGVSLEEGVQYSGGFQYGWSTISVEAGVQYKSVTSSVWTSVFNRGLAKLKLCTYVLIWENNLLQIISL